MNNNSELINYYKIEKSKDYITWEETYSDLRYNHVKEMIQYYEEKIYEKTVKKLKVETNLSRDKVEMRAKKKAWIDFIPVKLPSINKEERDIFQRNKKDAVEKYKRRLRKKLKSKFERAAKIREFSDAESQKFAAVSIAQLVDWVLTFLDACGDANNLTKDDLLQGNFNVDLKGAKVAAAALVKKGPKGEVSEKAEKATEEILNQMETNAVKQTVKGKADFPQQKGKETGITKEEVKKGVKNILGDLAAVDYPAWHATAMMIKKKYHKELEKADDNSKIFKQHTEYIMSFYTKEIFLNKAAAFFMKWFMKEGIKILKKSVKVAFPLDLALASTGLTLVFMGPPLADTIREELDKNIEVAMFEQGSPTEEVEVSLPAELFKNAYQNTIDRYNLVQKLEGYSSLYYAFTEEIEGEELSFIVKHKIDAPGAWAGICDFVQAIWNKGSRNLYSVLPKFAKRQAAPDKILTDLEQIENVLESYNEKLTKYEGIEAVHGYIDDIKKLVEDRGHIICDKKQGAYAGKFPKLEDKSESGRRQKQVENWVKEEEVPLPALDRMYDLDEVLKGNDKKGWDQFRFRAYFNPEVKEVINKYTSDDYSLDEIDFDNYSYFYYGGGRYNFYVKVFEGDNLTEAKWAEHPEGTKKRVLSTYAVKKVKETFPTLISKTRSMVLDKHVITDDRRQTYFNDSGVDILMMGDAAGHVTPIENIHRYKVVFKTLEKIAEKKGIKDQEIKRGRLTSEGDLLDCSWYSLAKIKRATDYDQVVDDFPLAERITREFVILHQDTTGNRPHNQETLQDIKFPEYDPNWDTLYGSAKKEQPGDQKKFTFKPGVGTSFHYDGAAGTKLASNPAEKIEINGAVIGDEAGKYEPVKGSNESIIDYWIRSIEQGKLRYKQDIDVDGKTLRIKYTYDIDGGWINPKHSTLPRHKKSPYLVIQYRYINEDNKKQEIEEPNWNRITIKQFENGDYGIDLPDNGGSLPGSRSDNNHKISSDEVGLENVTVEDAKAPGRGKLKHNGTFVKAENVTAKKVEDKRTIWKLNEGETLRDVAKLFYNDMSRWRELEKEDGSHYTEEEAREIPKGTKIYIPCK